MITLIDKSNSKGGWDHREQEKGNMIVFVLALFCLVLITLGVYLITEGIKSAITPTQEVTDVCRRSTP